MAKLKEFFKMLRRFEPAEVQRFEFASKYLPQHLYEELKKLMKLGKADVGVKFLTVLKEELPYVTGDSEFKDRFEEMNERIFEQFEKIAFEKFAWDAFLEIKNAVSPNIVGMDYIKLASVLQLFSKEKMHLLLLGDPGTGKTEILRSVSEFASISSFGLGSGTSGVGLAMTVKGNEVKPGLLPMANNGICCIDELNLMKEESRASLYNAMEKGFVTYDKGGVSEKLDAKVSILATANPKGDKFKGNAVDVIKKQCPFDEALLSRFHLVFLVKKPTDEEFKRITEQVVKDKSRKISVHDKRFIKNYVAKALESVDKVKVGKDIEKKVVDLAAELKKNQRKYLVEIDVRFIIGIMRMLKASARCELRKDVHMKDFDRVKAIVLESLKL
jgi:replicative DNA helicase Mcm